MQVFKPDSRAVGGGTGKPGVLQSTGSQRVRHDLVTENQQEEVGTKGRREGQRGEGRAFSSHRA